MRWDHRSLATWHLLSRYSGRWRVVVFLGATGLLGTSSCSDIPAPTEPKIKGFVFTGPARPPLDASMFTSMAEVGGNFVALVPEATVYRQNLRLGYDFENQWYGERTDATLQGARLARQAGLQVMLKPHLAVGWDVSEWERPQLDLRDPTARAAYTDSFRAFVATRLVSGQPGTVRVGNRVTRFGRSAGCGRRSCPGATIGGVDAGATRYQQPSDPNLNPLWHLDRIPQVPTAEAHTRPRPRFRSTRRIPSRDCLPMTPAS